MGMGCLNATDNVRRTEGITVLKKCKVGIQEYE